MTAGLTIGADLNRVHVFVVVVRCNSFTAAAEQLDMSKGRVSELVSRLERDLGQALFVRTTRRLALTDAGRALHARCAPLLDGLRGAVLGLREESAMLAGTLRLTTTVDHAAQYLAGSLPEFAKMHPRLSIELRSSDVVVDLVKEGIDVAIRGGPLPDSSLKARRLGSFEPYLLASPAYVAARGLPAEPQELAAHDWVAMKQIQSAQTLRLHSGQRSCSVRIHPRIWVDTTSSMRAVLEAGGGLGALDQQVAVGGLLAGRLVRILPGWSLPRVSVHAVYPLATVIPPATRAFVDFYAKYLNQSWSPEQSTSL